MAKDPATLARLPELARNLWWSWHLVQGVDVWLNTPRPPVEASGTSGEKAAVNGAPNLGVLDGWWAEGCDGTNGWAIGAPWREGEPDEARAAADAEALYRLLETEVTPRFSARRMVKEYVESLYLPAWPGRRR
ncbi:MAG: hypothetical protein HYU51_10230 [Candidatus Rokubacteria bacterium]|nr:hypothetical protein [Candidatus Rokubacteria bacterium]